MLKCMKSFKYLYDVNVNVKVQKYICFSPDAHGVYKSG